MVSEGQKVEYKNMRKNLHFEGEVVDVTDNEVVIQVEKRYDIYEENNHDEELEIVENDECLEIL